MLKLYGLEKIIQTTQCDGKTWVRTYVCSYNNKPLWLSREMWPALYTP